MNKLDIRIRRIKESDNLETLNSDNPVITPGVFIPKEVLEKTDLTAAEKLCLMIYKSGYTLIEDVAHFMQMEEQSVLNMKTRLNKKGYSIGKRRGIKNEK